MPTLNYCDRCMKPSEIGLFIRCPECRCLFCADCYMEHVNLPHEIVSPEKFRLYAAEANWDAVTVRLLLEPTPVEAWIRVDGRVVRICTRLPGTDAVAAGVGVGVDFLEAA